MMKYSLQLDGRKTSISVERPFWDELKNIAKRRGLSMMEIVSQIDATKPSNNLSSAVRVFVMNEVRNLKTGDGNAATRHHD